LESALDSDKNLLLLVMILNPQLEVVYLDLKIQEVIQIYLEITLEDSKAYLELKIQVKTK
jgi:hypothetical protein